MRLLVFVVSASSELEQLHSRGDTQIKFFTPGAIPNIEFAGKAVDLQGARSINNTWLRHSH